MQIYVATKKAIDWVAESQLRTEIKTNNQIQQEVNRIEGEIRRLIESSMRQEVNNVYEEEIIPEEDYFETEILLLLTAII